MGRSLVVVQIAIVFPLLVSASLLARTLGELKSVDPGFHTDHVLSMLLAIPRAKYPTDRAVAALWQRVVARVQTVPGDRMSRPTGFASLPLHSGRAPAWLFSRMVPSLPRDRHLSRK